MPTKKFSGRKLQKEEIFIHISGVYDKDRVLLNDQDTPIAPIVGRLINNDIQMMIMEYIGEKSVINTSTYDDYDDEGLYDEDDFIIDEEEREQERYEAMLERKEQYV